MRLQNTINVPVSLSGLGIHNGKPTELHVEPGGEDTGIVFIRSDLEGRPEVLASHQFVVCQSRQTVLEDGACRVETVEHFLAAAFGLGLDNLRVTLNGQELPAAGGSALAYVDLLERGGISAQESPKKMLKLDQPVIVTDGDVQLMALPHASGLKISYSLEYPDDVPLPNQFVSFPVNVESFKSELAPARTFCLESEALKLQELGLGLGANFDNTLVMGEHGVIENELHFEDEFARHKVLDLLGDLALLGTSLEAHIVASKSGHATNALLVKKLSQRLQGEAKADSSEASTGLDINEIQKIIPHRYPFLFLDRVLSIEGFERAVAIKNISFNEPQFQGHWPDQPIFPGVLQVEALAQLAGVLLLRRFDGVTQKAALMSIDKIKFRRPVVPGDQLRLECETLNFRSRSGKVLGRGTVDGETTVEATLKFMFMKG